MRKPALLCHAMLALIIGGFLTFYWTFMILYGNKPFPDPYRTVRMGPMFITLYMLTQYSVLLVPTAVLNALRALQLTKSGKYFPNWASLRAMSNLLATIALVFAIGLAAMDTPWERISKTDWRKEFARIMGNAPPPELPSDDKLKYPELPLQQPDPYDWAITDLEGNVVPMAEFRNKAVFLNIWATWCTYCVLEFPAIQRLYDGMKDNDDIAFVILSPEDPEVVKAWVAEKGYDLPFYTLEGKAPPSLSARSLPTTFMLAPDGRLAFRHSGFCNWDGAKTKDFLTELAQRNDSPSEALSTPPAEALAVETVPSAEPAGQ